jgi:DNA invertase Pin-like site-specific DNA recombinase
MKRFNPATVAISPPEPNCLTSAAEAIRSGHSVTIIVPKVDRLGRDVIDINQTVRRFEQLGVRILFLDINVDTRTPMGRAFMQIAAVFAELELARIRERIQSALDQKRANGLLTGTVPFGWDAVETGVRIIIRAAGILEIHATPLSP